MPLTFEAQVIDNEVAVIRCKGRITFGPEAEALEAEVNRQTKVAGTNIWEFKMVVLRLAETEFIDSTGLGVLVRLYSVLRGVGGGLKLCGMPPNVLKVIEVTGLATLFPPYGTEAEAVDAFSTHERRSDDHPETQRTRIVCVDPSKDLLAGMNALLTRSGYQVFATQYVGEAATLTKATRPGIVICGPGTADVPGTRSIIEKLGQIDGKIQVLQLPSDFHTTEAGQAGEDLLSQVRALAATA